MRLLKYFLFWIPFVLAVSVGAASSSYLFLSILKITSKFFFETPALVWGLPFLALLTKFVYKNYGGRSNLGSSLVYEELHRQKGEFIPFRSSILVFCFSLLSHLFGASVGREGVAVQISTALADQLRRFFRFTTEQRRILLMMGIAGGFAAIFGTPWAGLIFALETPRSERPIIKSLLPCLTTSFLAHHMTLSFGIEHGFLSAGPLPNSATLTILKAGLLGILCAFAARLYCICLQTLNRFSEATKYSYSTSFILSGIVTVLSLALKTDLFNGLGLQIIQNSFLEAQEISVVFGKALFTLLSTAAGLKGGEVTPLFAIGSALGSWSSIYLNFGTELAAAIGFVALFAGCVHAPWACAILGAELFGPSFFIYFLAACLISHRLSGNQSIYKAQQIKNKGWLR